MNRRAFLVGLPMIHLFQMGPGGREAGKPYDPRPHLTPAGRMVHALKARHLALRAGRGFGKTTLGQEMHAEIGTTMRGCSTVYMSTTAQRAVEATWDDFEEIAQRAGGRPYKSQPHYIRWLVTNGRTHVTGADRIELFNRKRGIKKIAFVHLDECQDWESDVLEYAVTKVFSPRLGDLEAEFGWKGRIMLTFTGAVKSKKSFLYRICHDPDPDGEIVAIGDLTQWENPHIADPDGEFISACRLARVPWRRLDEPVLSKHGGRPRWVDTDDEMTRREWFAEFNSGGNLQVFKVPDAALVKRADLPRGRVTQMITAWDWGTIDACAGACWLTYEHDPRPYWVESVAQTGLSAAQQVRYARETTAAWAEKYKPQEEPYFIADGGGLGKAFIIDVKEAEGAWEVEAAEKQDKVGNVRIMAGDLRNAAFGICDDLVDLLDELPLPTWDPDAVGDKLKGHMPDKIDAGYMGYRKVKMFHDYEPPPPPLSELDRENEVEKRIRAGMRRADA